MEKEVIMMGDSLFPMVEQTPTRTSSKSRSLSDTPKPNLSPSPAFLESARGSKDDIGVSLSAQTVSAKVKSSPKALSLQVPSSTKEASTPSLAGLGCAGSLSPKVDVSSSYSSSARILPRHSRGLDFSRACTNLHHSTLAEASSPESSPVLSARAMSIPKRKSMSILSATMDVGSNPHFTWSNNANSISTGLSSSLGSVNMLDSDSSDSESDSDELMDQTDGEDPMLTTPQLSRKTNVFANSSLSGGVAQSPGNGWLGGNTPGTPSFMDFQRARLHHRPSRKSSSSASGSGRSSMASPIPTSPTASKTSEHPNNNLFNRGFGQRDPELRRDSLVLGANDLNLSEAEGSDDGRSSQNNRGRGLGVSLATASGIEARKGVIKRTVTRKSNLLPKSKSFARVQALLVEEGAPIEYEARREAEVIHQVMESDIPIQQNRQRSFSTPAITSPNLFLARPAHESLDGIREDVTLNEAKTDGQATFSHQAIIKSGGKEFWDTMSETMRTPPPLSFHRGSSAGLSEDINMDTPNSVNNNRISGRPPTSRSRSSTPQPAPTSISGFSSSLKKRRREDDFDVECFKRRAVSPGVSLQNSPILPQSPAAKEGGIFWGVPFPPKGREQGYQSAGEQRGSIGPKRVGMQGMNDTNDGMMNMTIE